LVIKIRLVIYSEQIVNQKSIKTLFITRHLPYPPMGGAALRNWQNINIMLQFGSVAVVSLQSEESNVEAKYPSGVTLWKNYQIKSIDSKSSFVSQINQKLWFLQSQKHPWTIQLYSVKIVEELEKILLEFEPQIIVFEELWLYPYFQQLQSYRGYFIYDAHNVEVPLRQKLYNSVMGIKSRIEAAFLLTKIKAIESNFVRQANRVWVCSDDDAKIMRELYGQNLSFQVVPNGININDYETIRLGNCSVPKNCQFSPHTIIFTAAFAYKPNAVAAQILIEEIYPQLKLLYPDCYLLLVGRNPTQKMEEAAQNDPGIIVTGQVPDIRSYLAAASVVVAPLLEGGGTRLKILEAFAANRPVVSTSKGAEGLRVRDNEHLLIRDKTEEIVAGVCQLWSDESLGKKLAAAAYEVVKAEYSWQAVGCTVEEAIEDLIS
jgi:polysaccharide biosynthesis protein PslH